jgi:hypothetical protein
MTKRWIALGLNLAMAVLVAVAWRIMLHQSEDGTLSSAGLSSLRYYTVLSNLLLGLSSLAAAVFLALILAGRLQALPRWLTLLKYAAVTSTTVTFTTVMVYLGPVFGFPFMFQGANLHFHLIVPLLALAEALLLARERLAFTDALWAALPTLLYGIWYVVNCLVNGVEGNDVYYLMRSGPLVSVFAASVFLAGAWGIALLLRLPRR